MAQSPFQGEPPTLLRFAPQSFLRSLLSTKDDHSRDDGRVDGGEAPYPYHTLFQSM